MAAQHSGVDVAALDHSIRPQDDLYRHVNGHWIASYEIPPDRAMDGVTRRLHDQAEEQVRDIITELGGRADRTGVAAQVGGLYESFMDVERIEALGLAAIRDELAAIERVTDREELTTLLGTLQRTGGAGAMSFWVDTDRFEPDRYVVYLHQSGLGLPDEAYYHQPQHAAILQEYRAHLPRMLRLSGLGDAAAEEQAEQVLDLEHRLAAAHWDLVKGRNADLVYNPMTLAELQQAAPGFDWTQWTTALGAPVGAMASLVVRQPDFAIGFARLWAEAPLGQWQAWLRYHLMTERAALLHDAVVQANFDFYGRTLTGAPQLRERWKRGVSLVEGALGEAVGQVYVAEHFPPGHKQHMVELVENLVAAYRESISELDWMGEDTRARALEKLAAFTPKIGYPDKWKSYYDGLEIRPTTWSATSGGPPPTSRPASWPRSAAGRPRRVVHDPADGQRLLQPGDERDRLPGRDPAAAVLRPRRRRRRQLRRDRGGHRARDRARLRRPGLQVRRRGRLDDWWTERTGPSSTSRTQALVDQYAAVLPRPAARPAPGQRGADGRGEHRGPGRPGDRAQGVPDRAWPAAGEGAGHRRADRLQRFFLGWATGLAGQGPRRRGRSAGSPPTRTLRTSSAATAWCATSPSSTRRSTSSPATCSTCRRLSGCASGESGPGSPPRIGRVLVPTGPSG
jgi:putative endopeptidase